MRTASVSRLYGRTVPWQETVRRARVLPAVLLFFLCAGPAADAVTQISVDGHPDPVTLTVGETVTIRFDVAKTAGSVQWRLARDVTRSGRFDPAAPNNASTPITDGGGGDLDPASGKIALLFPITSVTPAGPYFFQVTDTSDGSTAVTPVWTVVPKPEAQAISGRVMLMSSGAPPTDTVVWAASDSKTLVASANIQPDGRYSLPLPPGTYLLFAEWFGNLHSQWQVVNLVAGQQRTGVDLPLLQGQEVSGTVSEAGQPMRDAIVQATAAGGAVFATRTFADGAWVLALPPGQYRLTAPGGTETVTVADQPIDGVDFPPAAAAPTPAVGTILTVAGNGIVGFGGDGRRATTARIPNNNGITVDAAGSLYIADSVICRVRKVDAVTGVITTVAGRTTIDTIRFLGPPLGRTGGFSGDGGAATAAEFIGPTELTVDAAGNLYISDAFNHRVRRVDPQGVVTTVVGSGPSGIGAPGGFGGDGGPATAARLNIPVGIALDAAGNLYVAERDNKRVRKVSPSGIISTVAGGGTAAFTEGAAATSVALVNPFGVAVDGAGNLYIGERGLNRILKMSPSGVLTTVAGTGKTGFSGDGGPATQAELNVPFDLALDRAGNLYFADRGNHRIRKVSAEEIISTVAGSGPAGPGSVGSFAGDGGPATEARLRTPSSVAVDPAGNLLISDSSNHRIRKVIGVAAPGIVAGR
jgi:sugar lactone lactonase YvrE